MCLWTIFRITFSNSLPVVDKRIIGRKFWGNFWPLPGFGNVTNFVSFQGFGIWDSRRQWLNKCVRCISGLIGRWLRHSFGIPSSPQTFLNFSEFINLRISQVLLLPRRCPLYMRPELGLCSPPAAHGFRHSGHEMWNSLLNNPQSRWFSPSGDMLFLKDHQIQSHSYFTTRGLLSISLSRRQAPWGSWAEFFFLQLNPCSHSAYVTSSLTRGWVCLLRIGFAFVKGKYRTYSIGLHGYGECPFFPGSGQSDKSDNLEWRTSHGISDVSLRAEPHLYVSHAAVCWAHSAVSKCHLH
jgi:hypothetical protein